jgi:hypothetical protein
MLDMEKEINFNGFFSKAYEGDENQIDNFSATVCFYKNGQVFLKAEQAIFDKLVEKMQKDNPAWIQYPTYKGDYQIKGTTSEGRKLSAITNFYLLQGDKIGLNDVSLSNTSDPNKENIIEARYSLANLPGLLKISANFLKHENALIIETQDNKISHNKDVIIPTAIMILKNPSGMSQEEYNHYSTWLGLILSFASGHIVEEIYSVKIFKIGNDTQELEYWHGRDYSYPKASGNRIIKSLDKFLGKIIGKVNSDNFDQKGLAIAIDWYVDCFNTTFAPTQFIILCTILETLSEKCLNLYKKKNTESEQIKQAIFEGLEQEDIQKILDTLEEEKQCLKNETNQKDENFRDALQKLIDKSLSPSQKTTLIKKSYYKNIKDKIINIFDQTKNKINDDKLQKYNICKQKIEEAFKGEFDNFNKPTFASKIKDMLTIYKVNYEDLFEEVDPLKFLQELNSVRNGLIHRGYTPIEKIKNYSFKLNSLVVRIILSIIDYDGDYWEQEKLEFPNPPQYDIYDRKYITFKKK